MSPSEQLSSRETQVATMVWEAKTNPEIAAVLGCTEQVIKNQLHGVFDKLGVWSRLELALYLASHGGANWTDNPELSDREAVSPSVTMSVTRGA